MALKTSNRDVLQIALDAGYGAHEAFTRAFRQMFGVSPSQYRTGKQPIPQRIEVTEMETAVFPEVRIETHPSRRVFFLRHVGPYSSVGPSFQKLMGHVFQNGLFRPDALILGICHDDPDVTPADKLRYDCAITVDENISATGDFGIQTIEGGEFAVATHRGPYETLSATYRGLYGTWLPASGREPRNAPPFEVYRNNPMDTKPEDLITEIFLPLAPR
jgi:AraC family transcriptional regulator